MNSTAQKIVMLLLAAGIAALVGVGLYQTQGPNPLLEGFRAEPPLIMDTETRLLAVLPPDEGARAKTALGQAEGALRDVQAKMDRYLDGSEITRLNNAPVGELVAMSPDTMSVLRLAHETWVRTDQAFDITVGALLQLWKEAADANALPTTEALAAAREASNWSLVELRENGAVRGGPGVRLDLGGIAKGYGIDRAIDALRQAGCKGGFVDVGGDVRCFGTNPEAPYWRLAVQDPFDVRRVRALAALKIADGAVCTSGNYQRVYRIGGESYSHIVDPRPGGRMGMALPPGRTPPSVTVYAPTAAVADAWATALSVLGADGIELIPKGSGIEAMLVVGTSRDNYKIELTPGFRKLFLVPPKRLAGGMVTARRDHDSAGVTGTPGMATRTWPWRPGDRR